MIGWWYHWCWNPNPLIMGPICIYSLQCSEKTLLDTQDQNHQMLPLSAPHPLPHLFGVYSSALRNKKTAVGLCLDMKKELFRPALVRMGWGAVINRPIQVMAQHNRRLFLADVIVQNGSSSKGLANGGEKSSVILEATSGSYVTFSMWLLRWLRGSRWPSQSAGWRSTHGSLWMRLEAAHIICAPLPLARTHSRGTQERLGNEVQLCTKEREERNFGE